MWVVTTDDRTVNLEGARRLEVTLRRADEGAAEAPLRDVTVSAVWPSGERETLAVIDAAPNDTPETLAHRATASIEAMRHTLHKAGQLCDLTGMADTHSEEDRDSGGPLW